MRGCLFFLFKPASAIFFVWLQDGGFHGVNSMGADKQGSTLVHVRRSNAPIAAFMSAVCADLSVAIANYVVN